MSGRKFIIIFILLIVVSGIGASLWIKQGYDTRPKNVMTMDANAQQPKPTTDPAAANPDSIKPAQPSK